MPTVLQFRRGTSAQNDAFTGALGEISVDTDKDTLRVHDGSTAGGSELLTASSTATLTNKTLTSANVTTALLPTTADGAVLGSASKEFSDLFLADASTIQLGNDQDVVLTHVADVGLTLKNSAANVGMKLTLQTGDTDIATNDILGSIECQAPDEGTGTDAILVAAGIEAVSEGDFSASSNATKLSFKTGSSEAATEKMSLSSGGNLNVTGNVSVGGNLDVTGTSDSNITNAGSIQLDSIAGDADTNTSIAFSGSDVITMTTGGTTALTINASQNVTIAGDLTISGDDLTMGTNTSGHIMVADGTNFNPVAVSGDVTIASNGAVTIANDAVEEAMIADDAVGADQLASNAVVNASVASGAAIAFSKMENLTASRALVSDGSGDVSAATTTSTEIGYVNGVTSAIQTQLDAKATAGFAVAMAIAL